MSNQTSNLTQAILLILYFSISSHHVLSAHNSGSIEKLLRNMKVLCVAIQDYKTGWITRNCKMLNVTCNFTYVSAGEILQAHGHCSGWPWSRDNGNKPRDPFPDGVSASEMAISAAAACNHHRTMMTGAHSSLVSSHPVAYLVEGG